ncbi:hypothetical protein R3P38DRAFT_668423 [Favolaschia claudopus]|uniref:Uncharacterized protein n=1 Tax=Favolaschia claudopus TaxID=2862362 RepID=A0AAW0E845_9AGAR
MTHVAWPSKALEVHKATKHFLLFPSIRPRSMSSYYNAQPSYAQPVYSTGGHRSHHGYNGYSGYEQPSNYGGQNVVYVPGHSSSHHSRHHHHHGPTVIEGTTVVTSSGGRHHGHHGRHHSSGHHHGRLSWADRIRRFFGMDRRYRHKSNTSSWGFLGRSRRRKYVDARSGAEVDRHGRQVYRV